MPFTPDADVAAKLNGTLGLVTGTNLFMGPVRAFNDAGSIPHKAVFCLATGGAPPMPFLGAAGVSYRIATVQVRIRGDLSSTGSDFADGQTLARNVRDALHCGSFASYVDVRVRETEPIYLGQDDLGHHDWAINVTMEYRA